MNTRIEVTFANDAMNGDQIEKQGPHHLVGVLETVESRGKAVYSFEYSTNWLQNPRSFTIDPLLSMTSGRAFSKGNKIFGFAQDASPDRWGRMLMKRREALDARLQKRAERSLGEIDFLLGVHNETRMGALQFRVLHPKLAQNGERNVV